MTAALLLALSALAGAAPTGLEDEATFLHVPAGREREVKALAGDLWGGEGSGLRIAGAEVAEATIRFRLREGGRAAGVLLVRHPADPRAPVEERLVPVGRAAWLLCEGACPEGLAGRVREASAPLLARRDAAASRIWAGEPPATGGPAASRPGARDEPEPGWRWARSGGGYVLLACLLLALAVSLRDVLRLHRGLLLALLGAFAAGTALRLALSPVEPLGVHTFDRIVPTVLVLLASPSAPFAAFARDGSDYFDLAFALHTVFAILLLPLVYGHASFALQDRRRGVLATAVFAVTPIPILFARSDVTFASSIVLSTASFVLLYAALRAKGRAASLAFGLASLLLFDFNLHIRPENVFFGPVALLVLLGPARPRLRESWPRLALVPAWIAWTVLGAAGVSGEGGGGLVSETPVESWVAGLTTYNVALDPTLHPFPLTVAAAAGAVFLWRGGRRPIAVLLLGWVLLFLLAHAVVLGVNDLIVARYGMHVVLPLAFLSAAGLDGFVEATRSARSAFRIAAVAVLVAGFAPAWALFHAPPDDRREEFAFLRDPGTRALLASADLVVEPVRPRFHRLGRRLDRGELRPFLRSAPALPSDLDPGATVLFYEGLGCYDDRRPADGPHPDCRAVLADREAGDWEVVLSRVVTGPPHDGTVGGPRVLRFHRLRRGSR